VSSRARSAASALDRAERGGLAAVNALLARRGAGQAQLPAMLRYWNDRVKVRPNLDLFSGCGGLSGGDVHDGAGHRSIVKAAARADRYGL